MNKKKIKQICQRFLIFVIVFSLICPGNLLTKQEKPGVMLRVTKLDGEVIKGELLKVEEDFLLLFLHESLTRVTISIKEIDIIEKKRKMTTSRGALLGVGIGFGVGVVTTFTVGKLQGYYMGEIAPVAFIIGLMSMIPGVAIGAIGGYELSYKTYPIKGKSQSTINIILHKLKKKARFKD